MSKTEEEVPYDDTRDSGSIIVEDLEKVYEMDIGEENVFSDLNFTVEPASFTSLIGKSGSGKSTLLQIISGVLKPTEGQVRFEAASGGEVELGHVFQSPRLLPWNTCVENIEYVHENNPDYSDDIAKRYLDMVGLSDQYDSYPTKLSGGQKQRVGIARALSVDPNVLLMDEPFSNLDEITAHQLRKELMDIWRDLRKTVLFVTHDINEAIELSDRIIMLGDGRIYEDMNIDIDRPRDVESDEFLKTRQEALRRFHSLEEVS